ncbi:MAG: hypothetical protein KJP07_13610 [Desulfatitalea sp.]|nr:hypothetical protein [Desulfatitalea sp.]
MIAHNDIKKLHENAYSYGQENRQKAANDLLFYYITHWTGAMLDTHLSFKGEFDVVKKAGRKIMSDLSTNPVQASFLPTAGTPDDAAETLDGLYRADDNNNNSIEAYEMAKNECVVCGVGGWELYTDFIDHRGMSKNQRIFRRPLLEMNSNGFWDPQATKLDKSDANYFSYLTRYTYDGYRNLVAELTGEDPEDINVSSFGSPEQSGSFQWVGGNGQIIYVADFYHRELVKDKILYLSDEFGQTTITLESKLSEVMDELLDAGFKIDDEKETKRYQVTKYIVSGDKILDSFEIAGENIPIVPVYGEYAYVGGVEHYEGVIRSAKDPQCLRDFQLSFLADIASRGPRDKPIFFPEQISSFEVMYEINGADNNYPYLLQNRKTPNGEPLPIGPVGIMPAPTIPKALAASIELSRQAVDDVASPGLPQDISDPSQMSGKAALAWQARMDMQSGVYQDHYKHAKRRDAEIYASMSNDVHDTPREERITLPDGTDKTIQLMSMVFDEEKGEMVVLNDLRNGSYEVKTKIGPNHASQRDATKQSLLEILRDMDPTDPARPMIQLKLLELTDGADTDDIRDYVRKQMIIRGYKEPETEEERQLAEQAQKVQEPGANMVLAQAEMLKGQADMMREQRENKKLELEYKKNGLELNISAYDSQTKRMSVQVDAKKAQAEIEAKKIDNYSKQLDNIGKLRGSLNTAPA